MAKAAAAKGMIAMSRARAAMAARAVTRGLHSTGGEVSGPGAGAAVNAARAATRGIHSTGGEAGGAGGAGAAANAARTVRRRIHSSSDKNNFETALTDHKRDTSKLLHEQNMKILKLQNQFDITKVELEGMKHDIRKEVIDGQITFFMVAVGVGAGVLASSFVFK